MGRRNMKSDFENKIRSTVNRLDRGERKTSQLMQKLAIENLRRREANSLRTSDMQENYQKEKNATRNFQYKVMSKLMNHD